MCIDILPTSIPFNQVQALCPPETRKRIEYSVTKLQMIMRHYVGAGN